MSSLKIKRKNLFLNSKERLRKSLSQAKTRVSPVEEVDIRTATETEHTNFNGNEQETTRLGNEVGEVASVNKVEDVETDKQYYKSTNDLTKLEQITLDNVLDCLIERFHSKEYYTFAGSVLISLNPCLTSRLSVEGFSTKYGNVNNVEGSPPPPHVYSIGQQSLQNLLTVGNNQVIVVTGDSGAGKTTATQQLIQYFIHRNRTLMNGKTPTNLEQKLYFATLILESLGNASTVANPNSSRFGRLVQLNYDTFNGCMKGALFRTCLLEKHRVSKCSLNERNFHIFYYMLFALRNGHLDISDFMENSQCQLNMSEVESLIPSYFFQSVKDTDKLEFLTLLQSIKNLNMTKELKFIFRIVFGIMVLLGVTFVPVDEDSEDDEASSTFGLNQYMIFHENDNIEDIISAIFMIDGNCLLHSLVVRRITAGPGSHRKSVYLKPCGSVQECEDRLFALTGALYDALFDHVLSRLNRMLRVHSTSYAYDCDNDFFGASTSNGTHDITNDGNTDPEHPIASLSLLDLYGFENMSTNHLEQLCINYANERLQQVHVDSLKSRYHQIIDYGGEVNDPVELNRVHQEISERIGELHSTLFSILNEECLLNRNKDDSGILQRVSADAKSSRHLKVTKLHDITNCPFIVKHYAADVEYNLKGMVTKNSDYVPPELPEVFQASSLFFVKLLFVNRLQENESSTPSRKAKRDKTILQRFKVSVDELVAELQKDDGQEVHFIRCVRPNNELTAGKIQREVVRNQLFACGIVDVIRIAGNGYPIRLARNKFLHEFSCVFRQLRVSISSSLECKEFVDVLGLGDEVKFGKDMVFMTMETWNFLKALQNSIFYRQSRVVQKAWKQYLIRKATKATEKINMELEIQRMASLEEAMKTNHENEENDVTNMEVDFKDDQKNANEILLEDLLESRDSGVASSISEKSSSIAGSQNTSPKLETAVLSQNQTKLVLHRRSFEEYRTEMQSDLAAVGLRLGNGLVTRGQVYDHPIKFYTRRTVLPYGHVFPQRLRSQGLNEVLSFEIEIDKIPEHTAVNNVAVGMMQD